MGQRCSTVDHTELGSRSNEHCGDIKFTDQKLSRPADSKLLHSHTLPSSPVAAFTYATIVQ